MNGPNFSRSSQVILKCRLFLDLEVLYIPVGAKPTLFHIRHRAKWCVNTEEMLILLTSMLEAEEHIFEKPQYRQN